MMEGAASSKRVRVVISINTSWNIYNFRRSLIEHLKAQGYYVITLAPHDSYSAKLAAIADEHIDLPMSNAGTSPIADAWLCWRYYRVLRRLKPNVLLGYTIKPNIYGTLAAAALKIAVVNNVSGLGTAFIRRNWLTKIVCGLYRFAFSFSQHVFFQNPEDQALFEQYGLVSPAKTSLLPGSGVDLTHFSPQPSLAQTAHDAPVFLLVARMLWDKGVGEFLQAARMLRKQYPNAKCVLVGATSVENKTAISSAEIAQWQREGLVEYWGESDDVRTVFAKADCVVLPSYREGMSRVLLEGCAMGLPLITTNVPGCKHIVTHGENGLLCEPRNGEDLAKQMMHFIQMPQAQRAAMGHASRQRAEREFDEQQVFVRYAQMIEECIR